MARGRKRGPARARTSDSDFIPKQAKRSKKKESPEKKSTDIGPRRGQGPQQQDADDEGIAATPGDTSLQAELENDDSTYDSSPSKQASQRTPQQISVRKNAKRAARNQRVFVQQSSGSFEAQLAGQNPVVAPSIATSKIVVLKLAPDTLREVVERLAAGPKKLVVVLKLPPEKLRRLQLETVEKEFLPETAEPEEPEEPTEGRTAEMAPVKEKDAHDVLDDHIKEVVQNLYDIGNITHGYLQESHNPLVNKSIDLTHSLAALSNLTAENSTHPDAPTIRSILVPPEVIDYVANGRNPDIYTREFVENVQRGNQVLNGKMQAFGQFAEIYARETKSAMPELAAATDRVMAHSGGFEKDPQTGDWKMKKEQADGS